MSPPRDYLRDPDEIYRRSFAIVRAETDLARLPAALHDVAVRIVHACGMPDVVADLDWRGDPGHAGRAALAGGRPVLADSHMVADGVIGERFPARNRVYCLLGEPGARVGGSPGQRPPAPRPPSIAGSPFSRVPSSPSAPPRPPSSACSSCSAKGPRLRR